MSVFSESRSRLRFFRNVRFFSFARVAGAARATLSVARATGLLSPLFGVRVDGVAVSAQYAALGDLRENGRQAVTRTLYHVGRVDNVAGAGAVLGCRVDVVKLQGAGVSVVAAHGAPGGGLDGIHKGANDAGLELTGCRCHG